jgi:hypothetical protein
MNKRKPSEMNFDDWKAVATSDPEAFEILRRAAIEAVIANAPKASQARLRCLQWRIDQERRLAGSPMSACIRLSCLMWRNVTGPGGLQERLGELQVLLGGGEQASRPHRATAEVVALVRD